MIQFKVRLQIEHRYKTCAPYRCATCLQANVYFLHQWVWFAPRTKRLQTARRNAYRSPKRGAKQPHFAVMQCLNCARSQRSNGIDLSTTRASHQGVFLDRTTTSQTFLVDTFFSFRMSYSCSNAE